MTAKNYQTTISGLLQSRLSDLDIRTEWSAFTGLRYQYSPKVDIAVGPFCIDPGSNYTRQYDNLLADVTVDALLRKIYACHVENIGEEWLNEITIPSYDILLRKNRNARCFIALEIENTSTKKHIMGSIVNAASLGRVGIGIAYNESVMRTFLRLINYLAFLKRVGKNTYDTTNFLIITKDQLHEILQEQRAHFRRR